MPFLQLNILHQSIDNNDTVASMLLKKGAIPAVSVSVDVIVTLRELMETRVGS